jgi:acetolactate synthase I/III small subunit
MVAREQPLELQPLKTGPIMTTKQHILTALVDNEPGVLSRVSGLFSGRGFNIESLCVAPTMDPNVSRITLTTKANQPLIEQIEKQINKLINVIKVRDLSVEPAIKREMALIRVKANAQTRAEILRIVDIFRCKVVDVGSAQYTLEVTGDQGKLDALLRLLKPIGIKEIARTGTVALYRDP